jgi:cyanophycinase
MKTYQRSLMTLTACLLASACTAPALQENNNDWHLLLVGGSANLCSSAFRSSCAEEQARAADWPEQARVGTAYQITDTRRSTILDSSYWPDHRKSIRLELEDALQHLAAKAGPSSLSESRLRNALPDSLSDRERLRVLDLLETFQAHPEHSDQRRREQVNIEATRDRHAVMIHQEFVRMAANAGDRERPRVLIFTSAARDPLAVVDYYLAAFDTAGAEVRWAPADPAVMTAVRRGECHRLDHWRQQVSNSWARERIYPDLTTAQDTLCREPDKLEALVDWADGVFFNGGDQFRHRQTLIDEQGETEAALQRIHERVEAGTLVVGGTSAGTAVQTGSGMAMITSGTPEAALLGQVKASHPPAVDCEQHQDCPEGTNSQTLTWLDGGIGLFPWGLLDTHYGERGRPVRSVALAAESGAPLSFGVDETTAMQVNLKQGRFRAIGAASVMIMDFNDAQLKVDTEGLTGRHILTHRLTHGEALELDSQGRLRPMDSGSESDADCPAPGKTSPLGKQGLAALAGQLRCEAVDQAHSHHAVDKSYWAFTVRAAENHRWLAPDTNGHAGWHSLQLDITRDSRPNKETME